MSVLTFAHFSFAFLICFAKSGEFTKRVRNFNREHFREVENYEAKTFNFCCSNSS
ncbi:hypothetical protein EV142_10485 [Flavobacterium circumlabens]|uniref:Uncharacterized protein n=1 Tax=Flavobacterium circumlabens TaxID=2133765 RepID=A0ABY2AYZ7_9FLAO|nr:hypothetical protein EV142_10485 [Flavobacterium circumlabens]